MLYVSHDLGAISRVCDQVVVMYAGEIVLTGTTRQVLLAPRHPYAHGLLTLNPALEQATLPLALDGRPPMPGEAINGCAFADRCALQMKNVGQHHPNCTLLPVVKMFAASKVN